MRTTSLAAALLPAALLLVPAPSQAASLHHETTRTTFHGEFTRVVVRDDGGLVRVHPGATSKVVADSYWNTVKPTVRMKLADGVLRVRAICPRTAGAGDVTVGGPNGCAVDLDLTIPAGAVVDVQDDLGDVVARGLTGSKVRLASDTGSIRALGIDTDDLRVVSSVGDVRVTVPAGAYDYRATSETGSVHVSGVTKSAGAARSMFLHSDTGDVRLTGS